MGDGQLGTDKDVEALVRRARRASWTVEVDGGTHIRWISPDRREFRSPLTGGRGHRQRVERRLAAMDPTQFGDLAPAVARRHEAAAVASILGVVPADLEVAAAELSALAELLDELVVGRDATVEDFDLAAETIREGRSLLRHAEDRIRDAVRVARSRSE